MQSVVDIKWKGKLSFEANSDNHKIVMDMDKDREGDDLGPRPKPLMLVALGGCSGLDVISILKKMKIEPEYFNMHIEASMTEDLPKRYDKINIIYEFKGDNLPLDKIKKAIDLSQEKYCGVSAVYRKSIEMSYDIKILK